MSTYFIALRPPVQLENEIRSFQKEFALNYRSSRQLNIPVHITLIAPFQIEENKEPELKKVLQEFASAKHPFTVQLMNFSCFDKRVIYLSVLEDSELMELQTALSQWTIEKRFTRPVSGDSKFRPHITLANRDLDKNNFELAWSDFKDRKFTASFATKEICLYRHDGKIWQLAGTFELNDTR